MSKQFNDAIQAGEIESEPTAQKVETRTGFVSGPGFTDLPIEYVVTDGVALWQGCIDLGPPEEVERHSAAVRARAAERASEDALTNSGVEQGQADGVPEQRGVGLPRTSAFLWTNGVMPYVINSGLPNSQRVTDALAHWTENSGMRFVLRTAANAASYPNYVEFVRNPNVNWSSSQVGMRGGRQLIRVSDAASDGTIIHEIGHAFGHMHEQTRSDRDQYVTINWQNITAGFESNFQKQSSMTDYYAYDYASIMHYPTWAFSSNGQPTIVPTQSGVTIGQRTGLSYGDRLTNAKMYERFFTKGHTGVWRQGTGRYGMWVNASWSSFLDKWNGWSAQGLRLTDLNVHYRNGQTRYSGVWQEGNGGYALWANVTWSSFVQKWSEWSRLGLRLVDINVHNVNGQNRYTGVYRSGRGSYALWANASWTSFVQKWQQLGARGLRLADIHVHNVNGQNRYTGVWVPGTGAYGLWANASWSSFIAKWQQLSGQGLRLIDMNVHRVNGQNRYSGVFVAGAGGHYLWANVTWQNFRAKWQQLAEQGLRLIDYEWIHTGTGPSYDAHDGATAKLMTPAGVRLEEDTGDGMGYLSEAEPSVPQPTGMPAIPGIPETMEADDTDADGVGGVSMATSVEVEADAVPADDPEHGGLVAAEATAASESDDGGVGAAIFDTDVDLPAKDTEAHGGVITETEYTH